VAVCWLLRLAGHPFAHGDASSEYDRPEMLSLTPPGTVEIAGVGDAVGLGDVGVGEAEGVAGADVGGGVEFCAVAVAGGDDEPRLLTMMTMSATAAAVPPASRLASIVRRRRWSWFAPGRPP
jgi:hypothetical protein